MGNQHTTVIQKPLVLLLLALLVGAAFLAGTPATAHANDTIDVIASDAEMDFPNNITFTLTAESREADIVEVELLYGATRAEGVTVVLPDFVPGPRVNVQHVLDTQTFHVPMGVELGYRWLLRDSDGNEMETPTEELLYFDTRFDWQQRNARGMTVHWYEGSAAFGDELMDISIRALDMLEQEVGATIDESVNIYVYANTRDMRAALRANSVEWVGGQANPGLGLIIGAIAPGDTAEAGRIIPHELSHQVLHQAVENPYGGLPLWFDEGLAVYNQEADDYIFPVIVEEAARTDTLIPLEALAASFPADTDRALLSYAQSHSVVAYIIDEYGMEATEQLVDAFAEATPVEKAIPDVLGMTIDELDAEWRATLPPAEVTAELNGSPSVAPADRFEGEPVRPSFDFERAEEPAATAPESPGSADVATPAPEASQVPLAPAAEAAAAQRVGIGLMELVLIAVAVLGMLAVTGLVAFVALRLAKSESTD